MRTRPRPGIMSDLVSISRLEKVNSSEATILPYFSSLLRGNEGVTTEPLPLDVASLPRSLAWRWKKLRGSCFADQRLQSNDFSMRNEKDTLASLAPLYTRTNTTTPSMHFSLQKQRWYVLWEWTTKVDVSGEGRWATSAASRAWIVLKLLTGREQSNRLLAAAVWGSCSI